jgi:hypothetical protein
MMIWVGITRSYLVADIQNVTRQQKVPTVLNVGAAAMLGPSVKMLPNFLDFQVVAAGIS